MVKEIIKEGDLTRTIPSYLRHPWNCSRCGCEFRCSEETDVRHDHGDQRDPYHHVSTSCPVCCIRVSKEVSTEDSKLYYARPRKPVIPPQCVRWEDHR